MCGRNSRGHGHGCCCDSSHRGRRERCRDGFAGPEGYCVCKECGYKEEHQRGVPCGSKKCPKCGALMVRE